MSDLSSVLIESKEWRDLSEMISCGSAPHALAVILPSELASSFRDSYARQLLCHSGTGSDDCVSCRSWTSDGHPDLVIVGNWGTPPGIADCLALYGQLSLKSVVAKGRLGVISSADNLSLPAANALLKTTEEPPEGGHVLFLAEQDGLISTIRSRAWMIRFKIPDSLLSASVAFPPPNTPMEWAGWFEANKKNSLEGIALDADGWVLWCCERGLWNKAASLRNLLFIALKRHLPVSMVQDVLYAFLKEGIYSEEIFGDLREA